jgi:hypothetical protein
MDRWLYSLIAILALTYLLQSRVRFLLEGRRYRRLSEAERAALADQEETLYEDHGRPIPTAQFILYVIVAALVLGALVCRDLRVWK